MKLVILDRDGVINFDSPDYIKSPQEWQAIPNSLEAIAQLKQAGFTVAVASNQSGIARGFYDHDILAAIHDKMQQQLFTLGTQVDSIHYCPHLPDHGCDCRKPKPGLLQEIATHYQADLTKSTFIGDRASDIQAAANAGSKAILVATAYSDQSNKLSEIDYPYEKFENLQAAADYLCQFD